MSDPVAEAPVCLCGSKVERGDKQRNKTNDLLSRWINTDWFLIVQEAKVPTELFVIPASCSLGFSGSSASSRMIAPERLPTPLAFQETRDPLRLPEESGYVCFLICAAGQVWAALTS